MQTIIHDAYSFDAETTAVASARLKFLLRTTFLHILQWQKIELKGWYKPGKQISNTKPMSPVDAFSRLPDIAIMRIAIMRALYITKAVSRNSQRLIAFYLARTFARIEEKI